MTCSRRDAQGIYMKAVLVLSANPPSTVGGTIDRGTLSGELRRISLRGRRASLQAGREPV